MVTGGHCGLLSTRHKFYLFNLTFDVALRIQSELFVWITEEF